MMLRFGIAATAIYLSLDPAFAAAPNGLLNKTVHVSFSAFTPNIGSDGRSVSTPRTYVITLYISSAGRIFDKMAMSNGRYSRDREIGPERTSSAFRFAGSQLIGTAVSGNAANQMTIRFDNDFQSCAVNVVFAGEHGSARVWTGLNGVTYTATGPTRFSDQSCSIQSGNALAN